MLSKHDDVQHSSVTQHCSVFQRTVNLFAKFVLLYWSFKHFAFFFLPGFELTEAHTKWSKMLVTF